MSGRLRTGWRAVWLALLWTIAGCGPAPQHSTPATSTPSASRPAGAVRIGLAVGVQEVVLQARGHWELRSAAGRVKLPDPCSLRGAATSDGLRVTGSEGLQRSDPHSVRFVPLQSDATLLLAGVPYRGSFELRADAAQLTLIETTDVQTYLRGVVTWEIGRQDEAARAAVEAQAIAARTYVISRIGQFDAQGFDVWADERDQVYKGALRDDPVADRAIDATRDQVLEYDGQLIQAYYSSTCGGFTSWIEHVWLKPKAPYLEGHRDALPGSGSWCAASRHFRWTEAWSGADLERTLQGTLPRVLQLDATTVVGSLLDLHIEERDASARVLNLEVRTTGGTWNVRGDPIRWVLKPGDRPLLRSLMFDLDIERQNGRIVRVVARGGGNGHGVGMCQMGALGMARAGYDRAAILAHYYPGTKLRTTS